MTITFEQAEDRNFETLLSMLDRPEKGNCILSEVIIDLIKGLELTEAQKSKLVCLAGVGKRTQENLGFFGEAKKYQDIIDLLS